MSTTASLRRAAALILTLACAEATAPAGRAPAGMAPAVSPCDQCASSILAWQSTRDGNGEIYSAAPDGTGPANLTQHAASDGSPAISPDGRSIAFSSDRAGTFDIWVMDVDGANPRRLTSGPDFELNPAWSPDGTRLAFVSASPSGFQIHLVTADGSSTSPLVTTAGLNAAPDWSPDGNRIAFHSDRTGNYDVWVIDLLTGSEARLTADPGYDAFPAWSPDGQSIAFASTRRSSEWDIYTMDTSGGAVVPRTSDPEVDAAPDWSPDGTQLTYERFLSPVSHAGEIHTLRLDGSGTANVTNHAADDRAPAWGPLAIEARDVGTTGLKVLLTYQDEQWQTGARPSATGGEYWIEARLVNERDPRRGPMRLGRIHDELVAYQLSVASYRLHLTYGPGSGAVSAYNLSPDLVTPVLIDVRDDRTAVESVDLTGVLGVIGGTVTVNGAAPGAGYSACVLMGAPRSSDPTFDWCLPLAADGAFRLLLPAIRGTLAICRTADVEAGACGRLDIEAGDALAVVPINVRRGETRTVDPIDILMSGLKVDLRYRDQTWSASDVPSATGAAYWIEGVLEPGRGSLLELGRIDDLASAYGMPAGSYDVRLVYGPVPGGTSRLGSRTTLVPVVGVLLDGHSTRSVTFDISTAVGVIELPVTVNGGEPGSGYSACVLLPGTQGSDPFRWCQPVPADGLFRLLLPRDGTGQVCLTREATGTECTPAGPTARGPLASFTFRVQPGRTTSLDTVDLALRSLRVTLAYQDREWSAPALPGATGADHWIEARLEPRSLRGATVELGRIGDVAEALALAGADYDLRLSYGPRPASQYSRTIPPADLVTPVRVSFGPAPGQSSVTVDLSGAVGVIEGSFTFNGGRPGPGYAFCISMGDVSSRTAFNWCPTLPDDGSIRFLLPDGTGTGAVCRAVDVVSSKCPSSALEPSVATVAFRVRAGETRNISSDLRTP